MTVDVIKPARQRLSRAGNPLSTTAHAAAGAIAAGGWQIAKTDKAAHRIDVPAKFDVGWEQWFLLTSDWHLDNPHCLRDRLRRTLDKAKERGAIHLVIGDALDLMQGKYDPRSNKADIRPEYLGKPYLSAVMDDWSQFVAPYASELALVTRGNHEQSVSRRVEFDIADNLSARVRADVPGARVQTGAYAGYVRLVFTTDNGQVRSIVVAYDHGSGGGGPVTRGVIGTNRRAVFTAEADWVLTGHVHERWHVEVTQERLSKAGKVTLRPQHHLCLGGWKEERLAGREWHVETGKPPKPIGGYWARVFIGDTNTRELAVEFMQTTT